MRETFVRFARLASRVTGSAGAFVLAVLVIVAWGASGPLFGFNDTWQLAINTGTTIVTFLMVFLIQSTQNRDSVAMQLKLDELIRAVSGARDELIDLEEDSEAKLKSEQEAFRDMAKRLHRTSRGSIDLAQTLKGALEEDGAGKPSGR